VDLQLVDVLRRRGLAATTSFAPDAHALSADIAAVGPNGSMDGLVTARLGVKDLPRYRGLEGSGPLYSVDVEIGSDLGQESGPEDDELRRKLHGCL
jgi:hypothetical protein